jgi:hypothetical protein
MRSNVGLCVSVELSFIYNFCILKFYM